MLKEKRNKRTHTQSRISSKTTRILLLLLREPTSSHAFQMRLVDYLDVDVLLIMLNLEIKIQLEPWPYFFRYKLDMISGRSYQFELKMGKLH